MSKEELIKLIESLDVCVVKSINIHYVDFKCVNQEVRNISWKYDE